MSATASGARDLQEGDDAVAGDVEDEAAVRSLRSASA